MCAVVHFEMPYKDRERAARFYAATFGWTHQMLGPEMGDYLLVSTAPPGARALMPPDAALGSINGGLFPFNPDWPMQHPSVVMGVEDIRAAMQRVTAAGGEVMGEPMAIPGVGEYVCFADTEGNRNSMIQPDMARPACNT
ncbi:MAG: VOC family protein [Gammaproteobacteria bacterium]|nr:VOC family protein [Rhodoferax sp.]MBU3899937.1 VOC family protein [Gammaproteobacteria bacterium]MBU3995999.1 VOC family protein [Gammaproteobacteria bacterium]MBU4019203.1 VOC family protein [Gammaproteobacteria bacterium]MBU4078921.1 VOC family protein [Gammaproteobacteria bacterium]